MAKNKRKTVSGLIKVNQQTRDEEKTWWGALQRWKEKKKEIIIVVGDEVGGLIYSQLVSQADWRRVLWFSSMWIRLNEYHQLGSSDKMLY